MRPHQHRPHPPPHPGDKFSWGHCRNSPLGSPRGPGCPRMGSLLLLCWTPPRRRGGRAGTPPTSRAFAPTPQGTVYRFFSVAAGALPGKYQRWPGGGNVGHVRTGWASMWPRVAAQCPPVWGRRPPRQGMVTGVAAQRGCRAAASVQGGSHQASIKCGHMCRAAGGQAADSPADICLPAGGAPAAQTPGWGGHGKPVAAPGAGGALFIASKQTNCFA